MLERGDTYEDTCARFRWRVPARYNIGVDICDKWAGEPERLALIYKRPPGQPGPDVARYTFRDLSRLSNKLANALTAHGIARGARVAILLPQAPETAIAHIAAYKLGAIAVPLFALFALFGESRDSIPISAPNLPAEYRAGARPARREAKWEEIRILSPELCPQNSQNCS